MDKRIGYYFLSEERINIKIDNENTSETVRAALRKYTCDHMLRYSICSDSQLIVEQGNVGVLVECNNDSTVCVRYTEECLSLIRKESRKLLFLFGDPPGMIRCTCPPPGLLPWWAIYLTPWAWGRGVCQKAEKLKTEIVNYLKEL